MTQIATLPSYSDLTTIFQKIQPNSHVAQIHGLLCGSLCSKIDNEIDLWKEVFPNIKKSRKGQQALKEIYETSYHQLSEFSFEFELLLPNDQVDINVRAEALGLWCQGFLTGLDQAHITIQNRPDDEVKEALDDIVDIAKINFGDIASNDEDEQAYFELLEYVRLSVLMIFHEIKNTPTENESDDNILH